MPKTGFNLTRKLQSHPLDPKNLKFKGVARSRQKAEKKSMKTFKKHKLGQRILDHLWKPGTGSIYKKRLESLGTLDRFNAPTNTTGGKTKKKKKIKKTKKTKKIKKTKKAKKTKKQRKNLKKKSSKK